MSAPSKQPKTMRALALVERQPTLQADRPTPNPPPGEALLQPTRMGVCQTDLELCKGYMQFDGVLGHEFVARVEAVANPEHKSWLGKRVVGDINAVCGTCDLCKKGLRSHCRNRTVLGLAGRDGCFAERFTLPVQNLHEVPDAIDDDHAVFTEPLAAALQIVRQLKIEGKPYITVLGDGRLGLLCAQALSQLNATVRVVGKHETKLRLCEKWNIPARTLDDVGYHRDQDIVVDATGSPTGLTTALKMVRPRGTIVLKTTVAPPAPGSNAPTPVDLAPLVVDEITVLGSRCGPFRDALQALAKKQIDVTSLITKRMKLNDGVDLLRAAHQPNTLKILLEP